MTEVAYRPRNPYYGEIPLEGGETIISGRFAGYRKVRGIVHCGACGCHPIIHRYKCAACESLVGWCVGADTEWCGDPSIEGHRVCDVCWHEAEKQALKDIYERIRKMWIERRRRARG